MMSAGPFVAWMKCSGNVCWGFSSFAWQRGTLQLIAIHLITLHNIVEYMQIAIIQTEAANFVKNNICVILKTIGHDCVFPLKELHWTLCKLETTHPEAAFIVAGDLNKANLRKTLLKFDQHIDCSTRAAKNTRSLLLPLPECLQGPPPPSHQQIRSQLNFAPPFL
jgi:hypothetical protein